MIPTRISPRKAEPRFGIALRWLDPIEGGWWPGGARDPNPTMRGITQRTYDAYRQQQGLPLQSVRLLSDAEHEAIYYANYWRLGGCPVVPWPLALVHFDACVNHGVGNARKLLRRCNTVEGYLTLRDALYNSIVARHPAQQPNLAGWKRRLARLRAFTETL